MDAVPDDRSELQRFEDLTAKLVNTPKPEYEGLAVGPLQSVHSDLSRHLSIGQAPPGCLSENQREAPKVGEVAHVEREHALIEVRNR